jgi:hypothetical protein
MMCEARGVFRMGEVFASCPRRSHWELEFICSYLNASMGVFISNPQGNWMSWEQVLVICLRRMNSTEIHGQPLIKLTHNLCS